MLLHMLNSSHLGEVSAPSFDTVSGAVPSACYDLWAGETTSYSGAGGLWKNLITTPNNGDTQTSFDVTMQDDVTNDDIVFSTDHFVMDGTDDKGRLASGANNDFFNSLHKKNAGESFWIAFYMDLVSGGTQYLLTSSDANQQGLMASITSSDVRIYQHGGAGTNYNVHTWQFKPSYSGKELIILSHDNDTGDAKLFINGAKDTQNFVHTPTATNPLREAIFFGRTDSYGVSPANTEVYGICGGNSFITDTEAADLKTLIEGR